MSLKYLGKLFSFSLLFLPFAVYCAAIEPDYFASQLESDQLEPLAKRLPEPALLMDSSMGNVRSGQYGGTLRILMGKDKDIRRMMVYGYARLVGYDASLNLFADILESYENIENKVFTFRLRKNHRWSDGEPFSSDDFKFYWEDIANNKDLNPFGLPSVLLVDGKPPVVEFPDQHTVIYRWEEPNPYFLAEIAGPRPLFIYQPKHYLMKYHPGYADPEVLAAKAKQAGKRNWASIYLNKARQYKLTNPELPSLQAWTNTTKPPAERYVFKRNPYFHRIDINGRQMPYIDEVVINIVSSSLIPAKTGAGESDLQGHYLRLDNYTFLKEGEKRNPYRVRLWNTLAGSYKALYPNLNSSDVIWRKLVRDRRFRRALSLGVNRHEINQVVYFGLTNEGNNTVLPGSNMYRPELQKNWATFDLEKANQILDEMGLTKRNDAGLRLRTDGKPLEIIIHSAGESTQETDILELIHDSWLALGIKVYSKPSQREVFRERIFAGEAMMSIATGIENGMPTANMSPHEFAPTRQDQYQWPKWGQHYESKGMVGEAPDLPQAQRLFELNEQWRKATDEATRSAIWSEMLQIHCDEIFSIGIVNLVPQPIVIHSRLVNVPEVATYAWLPTAFFGVYHPDIFWFKKD